MIFSPLWLKMQQEKSALSHSIAHRVFIGEGAHSLRLWKDWTQTQVTGKATFLTVWFHCWARLFRITAAPQTPELITAFVDKSCKSCDSTRRCSASHKWLYQQFLPADGTIPTVFPLSDFTDLMHWTLKQDIKSLFSSTFPKPGSWSPLPCNI